MNELGFTFRSFAPSIELKDLWKETVNFQARGRVQQNFGRIQQEGKESYCIIFTRREFDLDESMRVEIWREVKGTILLDFFAAFKAGEFYELESVSDAEEGRVYRYRYRYRSRYAVTSPRSSETTQRVNLPVSRPQLSRESFLERAKRLEKLGKIDAALDLIYDQIDELLRKGRFEEVDSFVQTADISALSLDMLLAMLTATLPARTKLFSRHELFLQVESVLKQRGEWEAGLLAGLEG